MLCYDTNDTYVKKFAVFLGCLCTGAPPNAASVDKEAVRTYDTEDARAPIAPPQHALHNTQDWCED